MNPNDFDDAVIVLPLFNSPEICLINFSDFGKASKYNWSLRKDGKIVSCIKYRTITLSRFLTGAKLTDHKDRNVLNNTRLNFRAATYQQNLFNTSKRRGATSKYKGVYFDKGTNRWCARIYLNGVKYYLGLFDSEVDAASAYDLKAKELFGEFANLNFKEALN